MRKNWLYRIFSVFLCVASVSIFSACKNDESTSLTFSELSSATLEFDTDVRPFLSTLEYSVTDSADKELLGVVTSTITGLSYEMGESFKSLNSVIAELSASADENTQILSTSTEIKLVTETINFVGKMNEERTEMSVICKSASKEYVYELAKSESGYIAQIATKNSTEDSFTVYQLKFSGTTGVLGVGFTENKYVSIFGAKILPEEFPSVSEKVYSVER